MARKNNKNAEYWKKRAERNLVNGEKSVKAYERQLKSTYNKTLLAMKKEIDSFYGKYAVENKISLADARKRLSKDELKSFKEQQRIYLEEIERIGTANVQNYTAHLKDLSARAYVSKLEELQANLRYHVETMTVGHETKFTELMTDTYLDSFHTSLFDVQQRLGFGVDFTSPGGKTLQLAVSEKWQGRNYVDSIWANKNKLLMELNTVIPQAFVRGKNSKELAVDLAKRLDVSESNARRLLRTEINYISNKASMKAYKESGVVEKYEYLATLDNRTSDVCIDMDGIVVPLNEAIVGVNYPPLHPNCRSTTVPYIEPDEFDEPEDRIARDENGKSYLVGADVTYKEWATEHASAAYVKKKFENYPKKQK